MGFDGKEVALWRAIFVQIQNAKKKAITIPCLEIGSLPEPASHQAKSH